MGKCRKEFAGKLKEGQARAERMSQDKELGKTVEKVNLTVNKPKSLELTIVVYQKTPFTNDEDKLMRETTAHNGD